MHSPINEIEVNIQGDAFTNVFQKKTYLYPRGR